MTRLAVLKTLKMYVGGRFIRSESGRVIPSTSSRGERMFVCRASRKDTRDAIQIARKAQPGWAGRTPYNRGQILYRLAEMLEDRRDALPTSSEDIDRAVDRAVHHAGWTDKIGAVLSTVNPVSSGHVNYSHVRPLGVVGALPRADDGLLGLVEAVCVPLVMGNSVIVAVPTEGAELATVFAEALATSDVPAGVANVLHGDVQVVLEWFDKHDDLDGLVLSETAVPSERVAASRHAAARVMRRVVERPGAKAPAGPDVLARLSELQTVWMSS